ncbi:tuzin-like protein [Leishmania donovani]|uniref:Tuzin-like protein n=1 Tax=Leishmania donovani TaxID=5661 RepID=A0A6J8FQ51_LEIDO|nr:tuzin-like protein [Leishmania donovani]VDZ48358.1 tuzin-like_protein/GeneDB:LmjF.34.1570/GeneDB:LmjF.34.1590/GeneDB:LmjF.34.1610/GeneDB:LmjF.34.1630/GeneDB:LmjF.34.1650/GeneDB:LmjF.34.1670/GeneDB:LmjF.34.1690/GeneDB:LmjF.34.1710/GeneDB:LmjF.34.1730/GeneDB:LmjF.34.1750/GeneDB:LmjF.34.1770/GeneDB:LmjF.34.1790/GeneDB:LmjF.34.1810/GeneDB:LmjF.34.1830/GeneDB:LmjF.34.1850/GeneDB:LmjF.34.1870/GeneDB:LmjF.34.1890/GeneDB:LmjF.34.1910/GeneDB:LmjF.34.1930/GeneDB:LmjF.34.1950/GeneDB:LmjF.34.1970/GeneDB:Lm
MRRIVAGRCLCGLGGRDGAAASASSRLCLFCCGLPSPSCGCGGTDFVLPHGGDGRECVCGRRGPSPSPQNPWNSLEGLLVGVRATHPANVFEDRPVALGRLLSRLSETTYKAELLGIGKRGCGGDERRGDAAQLPTVDAGTRVTVRMEGEPASAAAVGQPAVHMKGTIAKVNGNATCIILMENGEVELSVAPERIVELQSRKKLLHSARLVALVSWLRSCVHDPRDVEAIALVLFSRGWRAERMYLLESVDLLPFVFVSRVELDSISEKAQWERDHHKAMRMLRRERVKDKNFRYALAKYKGTMSCIAGVLVVGYVFTANLRAYRRQQRGHQLRTAIETLSKAARPSKEEGVLAADEEALVRSVLTQMAPSHPRIVAVAGGSGGGGCVPCRRAVRVDGVPLVHVDVGGTEDTLRCVVKALGVSNVEVCGDLLGFVEEAMRGATVQGSDGVPFLVMRLREGSDLGRVYGEVVSLVSDCQACHVILEVPVHSLTPLNVSLRRLDFYCIPPFSRRQAFAYTEHALDALDLVYFVEVVGTRGSDVDELCAALRQRGVDPVAYTSLMLVRAMRRLQAALGPPGSPARAAIRQLASMPFADGVRDDATGAMSVLGQPGVREMVLYDPVQDEWRFAQQVYHTAARCILV